MSILGTSKFRGKVTATNQELDIKEVSRRTNPQGCPCWMSWEKNKQAASFKGLTDLKADLELPHTAHTTSNNLVVVHRQ